MFKSNQTLNINKTKFVIFGSQNQNRNSPVCNLNVNGKNIEQVKVMKHLGVCLDDVLSFDLHIECLYDKAVKMFGAQVLSK